jgi:hypothetical protein
LFGLGRRRRRLPRRSPVDGLPLPPIMPSSSPAGTTSLLCRVSTPETLTPKRGVKRGVIEPHPLKGV